MSESFDELTFVGVAVGIDRPSFAVGLTAHQFAGIDGTIAERARPDHDFLCMNGRHGGRNQKESKNVCEERRTMFHTKKIALALA